MTGIILILTHVLLVRKYHIKAPLQTVLELASEVELGCPMGAFT